MVCKMDDVLIFGCNRAEHDVRVEAAFTRIKKAGITLIRDIHTYMHLDKKSYSSYVGHVVDRNGISADPSKVTDIAK